MSYLNQFTPWRPGICLIAPPEDRPELLENDHSKHSGGDDCRCPAVCHRNNAENPAPDEKLAMQGKRLEKSYTNVAARHHKRSEGF